MVGLPGTGKQAMPKPEAQLEQSSPFHPSHDPASKNQIKKKKNVIAMVHNSDQKTNLPSHTLKD